MTSKQPRPTPAPLPRAAILAVSAYIAAQMLSDVASVKIGSLSLPALGSLAVDMGTFIYPITFTLRDVVHKLLGRQATRTLVLAAGAINLAMAAYLVWAANFPSDASWGLGAEFAAVLAPMWRITLASIAAEVVSELLDTELYHLFVTRITRRYQWARVLVSNSLSVPVDNVIFAVGAFGGLLPWATVWGIFVVNLLVKYAVTLLSLPLIYVVPEQRGVE